LLLISLGPPRYNGKLLVSFATEGQNTPICVQYAQVLVQPFSLREQLRSGSREEGVFLRWRVQVYRFHFAMSAMVANDIARMQSATKRVAFRSRVWRMDLV
jgi:hypothetical protein